MGTQAKYEYTADMAEISGFGGGYEQACRDMVVAGLEWCDANPSAEPKFQGYSGVFGLIMESNEDAKSLGQAITDACDDCSGAMYQAAVGTVLRIQAIGWCAYCKEMRDAKANRMKSYQCAINTGYEDSFDIGVEYLARPVYDSDRMDAIMRECEKSGDETPANCGECLEVLDKKGRYIRVDLNMFVPMSDDEEGESDEEAD